MKYIIADCSKNNCTDLKAMLDEFEALEFKGCFCAMEEIEEGKVGIEYLNIYAKGNRQSRHHRNG
jgi:hypothetical protein